MDVRTVRPCHWTSRGRPTFTDTNSIASVRPGGRRFTRSCIPPTAGAAYASPLAPARGVRARLGRADAAADHGRVAVTRGRRDHGGIDVGIGAKDPHRAEDPAASARSLFRTCGPGGRPVLREHHAPR